MNEEQKKRAIQIWQKYCAETEDFLNKSGEFTDVELDQRRSEVIPEVMAVLQDYLSGITQLDEFKTRIDSINKRNRLWGFRGINGQMYFNLMTKTSQAGSKVSEFERLLKRSLPLPATLDAAVKIIDEFAQFTKSLAAYVKDLRAAPKVGAINFFLSYFWQIQAPLVYPVYYTSMVNALQESNLWSPTDIPSKSYASFYRLNYELQDLYGQEAGREVTLWEVEHALWYVNQPEQPTEISSPPPTEVTQTLSPVTQKAELPDSYIPPVVSILPRLAINDPEIASVCQEMGSSIDKVFENRVDALFKMLGYETESLGQGHGRVPDGVAICREFHYAIGYDAKVRQGSYTMGTDERAIREYIYGLTDRMKKQGIRQIYFMIISSAFSGDHDDVIRGLKMDTDAREILLVEASALVALLEAKLRDPLLTLGPEGIQRLLASSGVLKEADVREFVGL